MVHDMLSAKLPLTARVYRCDDWNKYRRFMKQPLGHDVKICVTMVALPPVALGVEPSGYDPVACVNVALLQLLSFPRIHSAIVANSRLKQVECVPTNKEVGEEGMQEWSWQPQQMPGANHAQ